MTQREYLPTYPNTPTVRYAMARYLTQLGYPVIRVHGRIDELLGVDTDPDTGRAQASYDTYCTCFQGDTCPHPGKHPRDAGWPSLATLDPDPWFTPFWGDEPPEDPSERDHYLHGNLGVVIPEGYVALDFDGREGEELWERLSEEFPELWESGYLASTPSGGIHAMLRDPEGEFRNAVRLGGEPLDLRGPGGFIVAPPSRTNLSYRFIFALTHVTALPLLSPGLRAWLRTALQNPQTRTGGPGSAADRPPFWRELLTPIRRHYLGEPQPAEAYLDPATHRIEAGERESTIFACCASLRAHDVPMPTAELIVTFIHDRYVDDHGSFPLAQALKTLRGAYRRYDPPAESEVSDDVAAIFRLLAQASPSAEPTPIAQREREAAITQTRIRTQDPGLSSDARRIIDQRDPFLLLKSGQPHTTDEALAARVAYSLRDEVRVFPAVKTNKVYATTPSGLWAPSVSRHEEATRKLAGPLTQEAEDLRDRANTARESGREADAASLEEEAANTARAARKLDDNGDKYRSVAKRVLTSPLLVREHDEDDRLITPTTYYDANPELLVVKGPQALNLQNLTLAPVLPEDHVSKVAGAPYDRNLAWTATRWNATLERNFPDELERLWVVTVLSMGVGVRKPPLVPIIFGAGGTGKGTVLDAIKAALGGYATTADRTVLIHAGRRASGGATPHLTALEGARFAVTGEEPGRDEKLEAGTLKTIAEQEAFTGRSLYEASRSVRVNATIVLQTNDLPAPDSELRSIRRRVALLPFEAELDLHEMTEAFKRELLDEELPAVLATLVECYHTWLHNPMSLSTHPPRMEAAFDEWMETYESAATFVNNFVIRSPDEVVPVYVLQQCYLAWCELKGLKVEDEQSLARELNRRSRKSTMRRINGQLVRVRNLKLDISAYPELKDTHDRALLYALRVQEPSAQTLHEL